MSSPLLPKINKAEFLAQMQENRFFVQDDAIALQTQGALLELAQAEYKNQKFKAAQIGKGNHKTLNSDIRSDETLWIENWQVPGLAEAHCLFEEILQLGRKELYLPLKRFESHFAHYAVGSHYLKHQDRHKNNPRRLLSAVLYFGNWQDQGGGELIIYNENPDMAPTLIEPQARRLVVFDSHLFHEVKITHIPRWSLTSWFRDDLDSTLRL